MHVNLFFAKSKKKKARKLTAGIECLGTQRELAGESKWAQVVLPALQGINNTLINFTHNEKPVDCERALRIWRLR